MLDQTMKVFRHRARVVAYAIPALRRLVENSKKQLNPEENFTFWNDELSSGGFSSYIEDTMTVGGAYSATALLIKHHAVACPTILDVACGSGHLVGKLTAFKHYTGTDVSSVAIERARRVVMDAFPDRHTDLSFEAADLRSFQPASALDVLIFNEVLYFLNVDQAGSEVIRYAESLTKSGIIIISMKDDGKSRAIFRSLQDSFEWIDGVLWQQKPKNFDFSVRVNRESPGFLVGALRKRK